MSAIVALFGNGGFRCAICTAPVDDGPCGCWERCQCGLQAVTALGEQRAKSLHTSKGCGNPDCSNHRIARGCQSVWWHRIDEGKTCVLPIGHTGKHRYSPPRERKARAGGG